MLKKWKSVEDYRAQLKFRSLKPAPKKLFLSSVVLFWMLLSCLPKGLRQKQTVSRMGGVLPDAESPLTASWGVEVPGDGMAAPWSPLCSLKDLLQSLLFSSRAAAAATRWWRCGGRSPPDRGKGSQDGPPQASSLQLPEEVETLVGLPDRTGSAGTPGVVVAMCTSRCL